VDGDNDEGIAILSLKKFKQNLILTILLAANDDR
jgi:hypothetical protein